VHTFAKVRHRIVAVVTGVLLALTGVTVTVIAAPPASAATICDQWGSVVAGNYIIQNNRWGSSATQCISTTSDGFSITEQDGTGNTSGAPVSYPSIYLGCHYSNCSPNSPLPAKISSMGDVPSSISDTFPSGGTWDAAYDIWLNATTDVSGVQDTEIMIWLNHQGGIQPIGSPTGSASLAGRSWTVWTGNNGGNNVVSYVAGSAISSLDFNVRDFVLDTLGRGSQYGTTSWYLTSIQAGFEPWIGGVGLAVNSFSASVGGSSGGGGGSVPGAPGTPATSNVTSNSVTLNWAASSGTVTGYQIERATGATGTSFSQVGTGSGTSFTDTGLTAGTTYRYRVRATNAAGNSAYSGIVNVTTSGSGGGGGSGACTTTTAVQSQWNTGYVLQLTVRNSGTTTLNSWTSTVTLPPGHALTNSWPIPATMSGQVVTEHSTAALAPGATASWGVQAGRADGNTQLPSTVTCGQ
jgi:hypothetical protein